MNKERLLQLADLLETEKVAQHFDMRRYFKYSGMPVIGNLPLPAGDLVEDCGSTACIAGWVVATFAPEYKGSDNVQNFAAQLLGFNAGDLVDLFVPQIDIPVDPEIDEFNEEYKSYNPFDATPKQAADVIRHLAETGEIDWTVTTWDESQIA